MVSGRYLRVRSDLNGGVYNTFLNVNNAIALPSAGKYKLTLYSFLYCPSTLCVNSDDLILIKIKEDGFSEFYDKTIFQVGIENGRIRDRSWIQEELYFEAHSNRIFVI